jgi:hypothetical protein
MEQSSSAEPPNSEHTALRQELIDQDRFDYGFEPAPAKKRATYIEYS